VADTTDESSGWQQIWLENGDKPPWRGERADEEFFDGLDELNWHFPEPRRALLPLCGNSPALPFLRKKGFEVVGVEFVREAVQMAFQTCFPDEAVTDTKAACGMSAFAVEGVSIVQGDYFSFTDESQFSLIYDRAALIAVEPHRRLEYGAVTQNLLRRGGLLFLKSIYFQGTDMERAPYSVPAAELSEIFPGLEIVAQDTREVFRDIDKLKQRGADKVVSSITLLTKK